MCSLSRYGKVVNVSLQDITPQLVDEDFMTWCGKWNPWPKDWNGCIGQQQPGEGVGIAQSPGSSRLVVGIQ